MKTLKTIGEAQGSMEPPSAADAAVGQPAVRDADLGRRKWMRGVVAVAPMVLTLRSGALAASSMTGVKAVGTLKPYQRSPADPTVWKVKDWNGIAPATGDLCVSDATTFGNGTTSPLQVATSDMGAYRTGTVTVDTPGNPQSKIYCQPLVGRAPYPTDREVPIAIMSASACNSLTGCRG